MRRRVRLSERRLNRIIKESVKRVLRESSYSRRYMGKPINEISYGLKKRASEAAFDKGKFDQGFRFEDNMSDEVIHALAQDRYFWSIDFDKDAYDLPEDWDYLDGLEKAKIVYDQSDYTDDDWAEYLGLLDTED